VAVHLEVKGSYPAMLNEPCAGDSGEIVNEMCGDTT
jgi:hypothetical protein